MGNLERIDGIARGSMLPADELAQLLGSFTDEDLEYASTLARAVSERVFGKTVYIRGIVEFTNYCKNNCIYCGIRRDNRNACRYRLSQEEILTCCREGYAGGFRTFVLQGGEDPWYNDERMCGIVSAIRAAFPDCAITLSLGERSYESYRLLKQAGADRYLLRHETADPAHYALLHPAEQTFQNRMDCLNMLRELGYQVGCGCMVGSPYQTPLHLAKDLIFMTQFRPHMIGLGPFIPHHDTPFRDEAAGTVRQSLMMLALCRLMLPEVLLPATTALGTLDPIGRERGILAGANVIMPNLSPVSVREKYMLYDNKLFSGDDPETSRKSIEQRVASVGYRVVMGRGDHPAFTAEARKGN